MAFFDELGLRPGAQVRLVEAAPFDGPVTAEVGDTRQALGRRVAQQVIVVSPTRPRTKARRS